MKQTSKLVHPEFFLTHLSPDVLGNIDTTKMLPFSELIRMSKLIDQKRSSQIKVKESNGDCFVERQGRVGMTILHNAYFEVDDKKVNTSLRIVNLSISGIATINNRYLACLEVGQEYEGDLITDGGKVRTTVRVIRKTRKTIGLSFVNNLYEVARIVNLYFSSEIEAIKMKPEIIKSPGSQNKNSFLLIGDRGHLSYCVEKDEVNDFKLSFFGQAIMGGKSQELVASHVFYDENELSFLFDKTKSICYEKKIPHELVCNGLKFIMNIKNISLHHKVQICYYLERHILNENALKEKKAA